MPIKPPNLDDRRYEELVREARSLIPQYCPEWTNLGDADPGMTLVQLFAWMTEMTIYRLNRVPDKTYIHFLNFIGEDRRQAQPASVPVTFYIRSEGRHAVEMPAFARCSTKQTSGRAALHYLTTDDLTVHDATIQRVVAVQAGEQPMVREVPFTTEEDLEQVMLFGGGRGLQVFRMDPVEHGPRAYTPHHFIYLAHDDFSLMTGPVQPGEDPGRIRLRTATEDHLPIGALFRWQHWTEDGWKAIDVVQEEQDVLGLPEISLKASMPNMVPVKSFGAEDDAFDIPEVVEGEKNWIRGVVEYERWLAHRMAEDLEITWRDDRGGDDRMITNWDVRATGRNVEFFIQDMPPVRAGWTVRFTMVDRAMAAGRNQYFPKYRWSYRKGDQWEVIPPDRVRYQGTTFILTGPFNDMATDGYNLRGERIETVNLRGLLNDLEVDSTWIRPVQLFLAAGPQDDSAAQIQTHQLPQLPYQPAPTLPPMLGMKFFMGADVFANRAERPVMIELEVGFELDGELIEDPKDKYSLQLTYRAPEAWRVVHTDDGRFNNFTFADLDPEGALVPDRRRIRILLDPKENLPDLFESAVGPQDSRWLCLELTKAALTHQENKKSPSLPISLKIFGVRLGVDGIIGNETYEQPLPGLKSAVVEYRPTNRRLTRAVVRTAGRLSESMPFDGFVDLVDEDGPAGQPGHAAIYMLFDKPLPVGQRHVISFQCRGETYLPAGTTVRWEHLEDAGHGRLRWRELASGDDSGVDVYRMDRTGFLDFPITEAIPSAKEGVWIRALFRVPGGGVPTLPPLSHVMLNTVRAINLHEFRMEKFSGEGIPNQSFSLRRSPIFLHEESGHSAFTYPDRFVDLRVLVEEEDGERREWRRAPGNTLLTASKDDRVFVVDPVEAALTFGNGIRGRMLPVGSYNVIVEVYYTVPGAVGNVGPGEVALAEGFADLVGVHNDLPAVGGRNAESIDEIIRRAPSVLTSRDRAVTRLDFELIAKEASGEVSRAACDGQMTDDGEIEVVILPARRPGEVTPDPFLSTGLKEHVQRYLAHRCLVNVQPSVRLATFQPVDVAITVRLKPQTNFIQVRAKAREWVRRFLDPYEGGLEGDGWPFSGTLFAQDFGRMIREIPDVRHVSKVRVFPVALEDSTPGWETGQGNDVLVLDSQDLFVVRGVRVVAEEAE
jgi:hypothetical protein